MSTPSTPPAPAHPAGPVIRSAAFVAGAGLIGAAAHATVAHSVGWSDPHALTIGAAAVAIVTGGLAIARAPWRWGLVIAAGLICGEAFALLTTAERAIAQRASAQAPAVAALEARQRAAHRLEAAEAAKTRADAQALTDAAKPGCRDRCTELIRQAKADAARELQEARAALDRLPAPVEASPLASRLGWQPGTLDLAVAALAALGANGLGAALVAFSAHAAPPPMTARERQRIRVAELGVDFQPPASVRSQIGSGDVERLRAFMDWQPSDDPGPPGTRQRAERTGNSGNVVTFRPSVRSDKPAAVLATIRAELAAGRSYPSQSDLCRTFDVPRSTMSDWLGAWEAAGQIPPRRTVGRCKAVGA